MTIKKGDKNIAGHKNSSTITYSTKTDLINGTDTTKVISPKVCKEAIDDYIQELDEVSEKKENRGIANGYAPLGENKKIPSEYLQGTTNKYTLNRGNDPLYNITISEETVHQTYEYTTPGTYTIDVPYSATAEVIICAGGSGGYAGQSDGYPYYIPGYSGAYYSGKIQLSSGVHTIAVGNAGSNGWGTNDGVVVYPTNGGTTTLDNLYTVTGGIYGYGNGTVSITGTEIERHGTGITYNGYGNPLTGGYAKISLTYTVPLGGDGNIHFNIDTERPLEWTDAQGNFNRVTEVSDIYCTYINDNYIESGGKAVVGRDGVYFPGSSYIRTREAFNPGDNGWEMYSRFYVTSFPGASAQYRTILSSYNTNNMKIAVNGDRKLWIFLSENSSTPVEITSQTNLELETWYGIKLEYIPTSSSFKYTIYDADGEVIETNTVSATTVLQSQWYISIGSIGTWYNYFNGAIDLSKTYIKIGNEVWWDCIGKVPDGTYKVVINKTNTPYLWNKNAFFSYIAPTDASEGDVWLNNQEPSTVKQLQNGNWVDFDDLILLDSFIKVSDGGVIDYNLPQYNNSYIAPNREFASGIGMPSDRYNNITLLSSGTVYVAPANGYFYINKVAGGDFAYTNIVNLSNGINSFSDAYRTSPCTSLCRALQGEEVRVDYNASGTLNAFRFYYAEGWKY